MRKWLIPAIVILILIFPSMVSAQNPISFSSMQIGIWPEFDKPSVLVIYQMTLSTTTTYPATLSLRIPSIAGEPNAVAARQVDGSLFNIDATRQVVGEWAMITFTTTTPELQLEYYDPSMTISDASRHFTYNWPGDYSVTEMTVQVQQPFDATQMRISPSLGSGAVGSDNLTYYTQDIGSVAAGQNFQISVDYQKASSVLSAENLPLEPSATTPQGTVTNLNLQTWLPWLLGILGAALIIGGIVWFWQSGRQRPAFKPRMRRSRSETYDTGPVTELAEDTTYCSQCGKRALPGDLYCRYCGSPIRNQ